MKKIILGLVVFTALYALPSCSNNKKEDKTGDTKETPAAVAQTWCDLNSKLTKAGEDGKDQAKQALKDYEDMIETKYKDDKDMKKAIENEVEKCEEASEGR